MFFVTPSAKFSPTLKVHKLSGHAEEKLWLTQAAAWAEEKWGYIRNYPGITERIKIITKLKENFYIVTYDKQPVGMFALLDYKALESKQAIKELMYLYVDKSFRNMGIGSQMIKIAKGIAKQQGCESIVFDTLTPSLNGFYKKQGAKVICEGQLLGHPTTVLRMKTS